MNYVYVALVFVAGASFIAGMLAMLALPGARPEAPLPPRKPDWDAISRETNR